MKSRTKKICTDAGGGAEGRPGLTLQLRVLLVVAFGFFDGVLLFYLEQQIGGKYLASTTVVDLQKIKGLGPTKAGQIIAALELGRRLLKDKKTVLHLTPADVYEQLRDIRELKKEHFVILFLDSRSQEIKRETISVGTLNASLVHPREVFEPAIKCNAAQIIVAHNHPSGDPEPSGEDIEITKRLSKAGELLGIELIDHVIVTGKGFRSFRQNDLL